MILFTIILGISSYQVIDNCKDIAGVYFSKDDSRSRVLSICRDTLTDQVIEHELEHICFHNHVHSFRTDEELNKHLAQQTYLEEQAIAIIAPCMVENRDKLYKALEKYENIHLRKIR
jgi:hypothetical protein